MNSFDEFGAAFIDLMDQVAPSAMPELLDAALRKSSIGGLRPMTDLLETSGFADRVRAWKAGNELASISPSEIAEALGRHGVASLEKAWDVPEKSAIDLLSRRLPTAISEASKQHLDDARGKKTAS